jgi:hypothetical protein
MAFVLHSRQLLLVTLAGWINQQQIIDFQRTEIEVLREKLGKKRMILSDDQRRRLFVLLAAFLRSPGAHALRTRQLVARSLFAIIGSSRHPVIAAHGRPGANPAVWSPRATVQCLK